MHAPEKEYCKVNAESHGAPTLLRPFASAGVEEKFKLPDPLKSWRERNSILAEAPHFFPCCCFRTYEGINAESWVAGRGIVLYPGVAVDGGGTGESTGIPG